MSEITVKETTPWWLGRGYDGMYLAVRCGDGDAYLLVCKSDGHTTVGYLDEQRYLPTLDTAEEAKDWARLFDWRARQTFPWTGEAQ